MKKAVMRRAWAIARSAAELHGGKASEYIAGALRMAWAETNPAFGFRVLAKKNGELHFIVDDNADLDVYVAYNARSNYDGRVITKRSTVEYKKAVEKSTNKAVRVYAVAFGTNPITFKLGNKIAKLHTERGNLKWAN